MPGPAALRNAGRVEPSIGYAPGVRNSEMSARSFLSAIKVIAFRRLTHLVRRWCCSGHLPR